MPWRGTTKHAHGISGTMRDALPEGAIAIIFACAFVCVGFAINAWVVWLVSQVFPTGQLPPIKKPRSIQYRWRKRKTKS